MGWWRLRWQLVRSLQQDRCFTDKIGSTPQLQASSIYRVRVARILKRHPIEEIGERCRIHLGYIRYMYPFCKILWLACSAIGGISISHTKERV
ncbi:MAG: hypothetical protein K0R67_3150 [Paenibacillus sp.]|nr:hypothetical protein [Paenibacillus sp.]